jgi:hypothetical protein
MGWISDNDAAILRAIRAEGASLTRDESLLKQVLDDLAALHEENQALATKVDQILVALQPPPLVAFEVTVTIPTQGEDMKASKLQGKLKIDLIDGGKTCRVTAVAVDAMKNPANPPGLPDGSSVPTWAAVPPAGLTLAADPADTTGSGLVQIGTPTGILATGIIVSVTATLPSPDGGTTAGATITGDNSDNPINIVAGPAGGFLVTVA